MGYYSNSTSNFTNSRLMLLAGTVEDYATKDGSTLAAGKAYLVLPKIHKKREVVSVTFDTTSQINVSRFYCGRL